MAQFEQLGQRVLVRPPGTKDRPEHLPGIVTAYDPKTRKASIVAWKPEGYNVTIHGCPYEPDMLLNLPGCGCWCLFSDITVEETIAEKNPEPVTI